MQIIFANTKNISCALVLLVTLSEPANGSTASFKLDAPRAAGAQSPAATRTTPIFIFHADEFWLNLHHFLYVLGRSANKTRDSSREAVVHAPAASGLDDAEAEDLALELLVGVDAQRRGRGCNSA